jgi:alginate O-acetyltransferase complex protein AlgI
MVFSSLTFVCLFLPLVVALYFVLPRSARNPLLVVASLVFYGWGEPRALVLVALSVLVNFRLGLLLEAAEGSRRRRLITAAVALNLLVLIVFKYAAFLVENVNALVGAVSTYRLPEPRISLPLGISFFTFHLISYLVDVFRGVVPPQRSLAAFTLYIVNFPQLIAGPIIRYRQIAGQLEGRQVTFDDVDAGVGRFTAGLTKKLLVANPVGAIADQVFAIPGSQLSMGTAWLGVVGYTLQIYFDFSGYSDMAIGLARIFGFRFPENFAYPYAATSMQDFWRRWHISLSSWFRDYVYIPLGGSRDGSWATVRNLWIVFLLTGIWHGASWNFVAWGMWHGLFLWIERIERFRRTVAISPAWARRAYVLLVVMIGWVFFRAPTLGAALEMLRSLLGGTSEAAYGLPPATYLSIPMLGLILMAGCLAFPIWPRIRASFEPREDGAGAVGVGLARAALVGAAMVLALATMAVEQHNPFIYFRF